MPYLKHWTRLKNPVEYKTLLKTSATVHSTGMKTMTTENTLAYFGNKNRLTPLACIIKNITIVNNASRVISEWRNNLERHSKPSITFLESSIILQVSSIMRLENIYSRGVTHGDRNMFIVEATSLLLILFDIHERKNIEVIEGNFIFQNWLFYK